MRPISKTKRCPKEKWQREECKRLYIEEKWNIPELAKRYRMTNEMMKKWLHNKRCLKNYIFEGVTYRKCNLCNMYKPIEENFSSFNKKSRGQGFEYRSECKPCYRNMRINYRKIRIIKGDNIREKEREYANKKNYLIDYRKRATKKKLKGILTPQK